MNIYYALGIRDMVVNKTNTVPSIFTFRRRDKTQQMVRKVTVIMVTLKEVEGDVMFQESFDSFQFGAGVGWGGVENSISFLLSIKYKEKRSPYTDLCSFRLS